MTIDNLDKVYFTSDTHFYHKNIIRYCNRPFESIEEMNRSLIENWNNKVPKDAIVFHLGDFAFCNESQIKELVSQLNGRTILIKGNHDAKNDKFLNSVFSEVYPQLYLVANKQPIYLNHFPLLCYPSHAWNFFGHVHSKPGSIGTDTSKLKYCASTRYDVGVDLNNYTPISFEEAKEKIQTQITNNANITMWL